MSDDVRTYTIDQAAKILGIGRNAAYEAAQQGNLPTIRMGRRLLVPKAALDQFVGRSQQPESAPDHSEVIERLERIEAILRAHFR